MSFNTKTYNKEYLRRYRQKNREKMNEYARNKRIKWKESGHIPVIRAITLTEKQQKEKEKLLNLYFG